MDWTGGQGRLTEGLGPAPGHQLKGEPRMGSDAKVKGQISV